MYWVPAYKLRNLQHEGRFFHKMSLSAMDEGDRAKALIYQGKSDACYRFVRAVMGIHDGTI